MMLENLINTLNGNLNELIAVPILAISSIYLRILLEIFGQTWVPTKAHTGTLMLLPIIVYVITSVISGNIALSLGMVGALSIVRFRNPVRSPLELASYFCTITLGIAAAVSLLWVVFLIGSVTFVIIILVSLNYLLTKCLNRPFFITSFSEGNSLSTLNITSKTEILELNSSDALISKINSDGVINYTLASNDFSKLCEIEKKLMDLKDILASEVRR